jgi:NSS family neurotransmitter:Na+ symporter
MLELATRVLIDAGLARRAALAWVAGAGFVFGLPSALSLDVFNNQDWVWGVGLMVSGFFFALAAARFGLERLRTEVVNLEGADLRIGRWWVVAVGVLVPVEAVVLLIWWLVWQGGGWDPFKPFSAGTVLLQFTIALVALLAGWLAGTTVRRAAEAPSAGGEIS